METIPKSECRQIGTIRKTHGVHGRLILEFNPQFEDTIEQTKHLFLEIDGLLVPFFISPDGIQFSSDNTAIITFDWVDTQEYARRFTGCPVYLFTHEAGDDVVESTEHPFLHYRLLDAGGKEVGKISASDNYSGNIVFTIDAGGKEFLVPFNEDILVHTDENKKTITLIIPEGLLE